jgi:plasmid maintenance system killer protein
MKVYFRTNRLERAYFESRIAHREWGKAVGSRYALRIRQIIAAKAVADLYTLAGAHFHPLTGDREGQYGITLLGLSRLVVTLDEAGPSVMVIEVVDYH